MAITHIVPEKHGLVDGKYIKTADEYSETFAHGKVLQVGTQSYQIMSDIWGTEKYAKYWDPQAKRIRHCTLDICDYQYSYGDRVHAEVDATEEVYQELLEHLYQEYLEDRIAHAEKAAQNIYKGSMVEVVSGRKGKGTKGKVVVDMLAQYNMGYSSATRHKFAIALDDEMVDVAAKNGKVYRNYKNVVWVWKHNCRLITVPPINMEEIKEGAKKAAVHGVQAWRRQAESCGRRLAA